jgi:hypothetical protein
MFQTKYYLIWFKHCKNILILIKLKISLMNFKKEFINKNYYILNIS